MSHTKIEYVDRTWNPVTGCAPISAGCRNCYAARFARRLAGRAGYPADDPFRVTMHPERLAEPFRWATPQCILTCSMGDLFHEAVSDQFLRRVFGTISFLGEHTFLVLTKRAERMAGFFRRHTLVECGNEFRQQPQTEPIAGALERRNRRLATLVGCDGETVKRCQRALWGDGRGCWPLPNVWLGVSVEDQATADDRIPYLLETPAAVRWISYEPALGPVDLTDFTHDLPTDGLQARLDWVVAGGETGPKARPPMPGWFRQVRDCCQAFHVPFFFKSWGGQWRRRQQAGASLAGRLVALAMLRGEGQYTASEVRKAAMVAMTKYEMLACRRLWLAPDEPLLPVRPPAAAEP